MEVIWKKHVFGYCGLKQVECFTLNNFKEADHRLKTDWLSFVADTVKKWFPAE